MTSHTNLEEYDDPELYDLENDDFEPDGPFYLSYAQQLGGAVLEIGCGTGRHTIPMAQHGMAMTGLDLLPQMIERGKSKAAALPIAWVLADARQFSLGQRFRLIFESGAAFQHLLERPDQEAMLARVREHLEPEGRFIVSEMFPGVAMQGTDETVREWFQYMHPAGYEVRLSGTQHYDPIRQIKTETAYRRWTDANGQEVVKVAPLALRYLFPQELEALLHYNGFAVEERYGNWDKSPMTHESHFLIYVCKLRG